MRPGSAQPFFSNSFPPPVASLLAVPWTSAVKGPDPGLTRLHMHAKTRVSWLCVCVHCHLQFLWIITLCVCVLWTCIHQMTLLICHICVVNAYYLCSLLSIAISNGYHILIWILHSFHHPSYRKEVYYTEGRAKKKKKRSSTFLIHCLPCFPPYAPPCASFSKRKYFSSAPRIHWMLAPSLFNVSTYSSCGSESNTIPPPA